LSLLSKYKVLEAKASLLRVQGQHRLYSKTLFPKRKKGLTLNENLIFHKVTLQISRGYDKFFSKDLGMNSYLNGG
jgi:hypothetical protein